MQPYLAFVPNRLSEVWAAAENDVWRVGAANGLIHHVAVDLLKGFSVTKLLISPQPHMDG